MRIKTMIVALALLGVASLPAKAQSHIYYNGPRTPTPFVFHAFTTAQWARGLE